MNRLGESITLSGHGMFVRTNAFRRGIGLSILLAAPISPGASSLGSVTSGISAAATGTTCDFVTTVADALSDCLVSYGPAVSPGVSSFKGPYSFFDVITMTATGFTGAVQSQFRYGAILAGERRPFRIAGADANGKLSNVYEQIVTVGA